MELINGLEKTKIISNEIFTKQEIAHSTQIKIKSSSEKYRSVAKRSSILFFLMNDLIKIHTYYIYSLEAFIIVFYRGIDLVNKELSALNNNSNNGDDNNLIENTTTDNVNNTDVATNNSELNHTDSTLANKTDSTINLNTKSDSIKLNASSPTANINTNMEMNIAEENESEIKARCVLLVDSITKTLFSYIRRGLFEADKITAVR